MSFDADTNDLTSIYDLVRYCMIMLTGGHSALWYVEKSYDEQRTGHSMNGSYERLDDSLMNGVRMAPG